MSTNCTGPLCENEATMGVRTTAPGSLKTTIYWDAEDAPKAAELLCERHGAALLASLAGSLGRQPDREPEPEQQSEPEPVPVPE